MALPAIVEGVKDKSMYPGGPSHEEGPYYSTNREHRVRLYLCCEAKGETGEFIGDSYCEHLSTAGRQALPSLECRWRLDGCVPTDGEMLLKLASNSR